MERTWDLGSENLGLESWLCHLPSLAKSLTSCLLWKVGVINACGFYEDQMPY